MLCKCKKLHIVGPIGTGIHKMHKAHGKSSPAPSAMGDELLTDSPLVLCQDSHEHHCSTDAAISPALLNLWKTSTTPLWEYIPLNINQWKTGRHVYWDHITFLLEPGPHVSQVDLKCAR